MPKCNDKPCPQCPFRRKSAPGWLGAATPEELMAAAINDYPLPCHMTLDYQDPDWKEKWEKDVRSNTDGTMHYCAGAAVFFANRFQRSRDPKRPRLPVDRDNVFSAPQEFIWHHASSPVKSWEFGDDHAEEARVQIDEDERTP